MGTSRKYPGPRGGRWTAANNRLGRWVSGLDQNATAATGRNASTRGAAQQLSRESSETARDIADRYRAALAAELTEDPAAFGLRDALQIAGARLVDTLESLRTGDAGWLSCEEEPQDAREDAFVRDFAGQVAGSGGLVTDAIVRQAAVTCAQELLNMPGPLQEAIRAGRPIQGTGIVGEVFCLVFQLFFKDALARFIETIVAGKVRLAFPLLHVIDPAGKISDWVGQQVAALIPNPCEQGETLADRPSLADLANGLITESVDRALGIPITPPGSAAA
jgi:hypothetical protein